MRDAPDAAIGNTERDSLVFGAEETDNPISFRVSEAASPAGRTDGRWYDFRPQEVRACSGNDCMSLRLKIALIGLPLFLVLFAALHLTARNVLVRSFDAMEMDAARQQADTALRVVENSQSQMVALTKDWAYWDDTYEFVQDGNEAYITSNLADSTFTTLHLSVMAFVDLSGRVVCARAFDLERNKAVPVPTSFLRRLQAKNAPFFGKSGISGILLLPEGPMMIVSRPVLTSARTGPAKGTLVFGRILGNTAVKGFKSLTNTDLSLRRLTDEKAFAGLGRTGSLPSGERVVTRQSSERIMETNVLLRDVYGRPALVMTIPMRRTIHLQGMASLRLLDLSIALLGIAFVLLSFFATERLLLRRLSRLQGQLQSIDVKGELSRRMTVTGRDEMSSFASTVNHLLDSLQRYRDKDRAVLEAIPDAMILFSPDGVFLDYHRPNREDSEALEYDYVGKSLSEVLQPEMADLVFSAMRQARETGRAQSVELQFIRQDGQTRQLESRIGAIGDGSFLAVTRDITERKHAEAHLRMQTSAMNAAGDQIAITDPNGNIEFVNPALERAAGYSRDEALGRNITMFTSGPSSEAQSQTIWNTVRAGKTWHGEVMTRRKDGTVCSEEMTVTPVKNEAGVVEHFVAIKRDITDKKVYEARLDQLAHHDSLTGLPNRLLFSDRLTQRIAEARRRGEQLAVMFLDMDRFKLINDTLGHNTGDIILQEVAERLKSTLRDVDTVARMGGDEFTLILSQVRNGEEAAMIGRRILEILSKPFALGGHELFLTASVGISLFPSDGSDVEMLVRNADAAMYHAKEQGRNTFHFYTEALNIAAVERMTLEAGLRKALERDELLAYYQPRVNVRTSEIVGIEALIRWQHPDLKLIAPAQFIPLAEETGLIVPMGEWMLRTACAQNKQWQESGLPPIEMGVNVSARQFQLADLVETVTRALRDTHLDPRYLVLELTESALMLNPEHAVSVLRDLKKLGVKVFIDDFGTGYSSLSHLKHFPIDAVKIDGSFIRGVTHDPDDAAIAGAVVAMAHSLKLKVIAEGVETLGQLDFLRSLDCDEMQGYFVSRPAPAEELLHALQASSLLSASVR